MFFLRDWWRDCAFTRYFAELEPIDRVTFWIAAALALAIGISFSMIVHP